MDDLKKKLSKQEYIKLEQKYLGLISMFWNCIFFWN